jgi:hypothetical protein
MCPCYHVLIVLSSLADLVQRVAVWSLLGSLNTVCTSAWLHPFACLLDVCMTAVSQGCCCRTTAVTQQSLLAMLWSTQGLLDLATVLHCLMITHLHCIAPAYFVYSNSTPITNISLSYPFGTHSGPMDGNLIAFVHNYIQSQ